MQFKAFNFFKKNSRFQCSGEFAGVLKKTTVVVTPSLSRSRASEKSMITDKIV